MGLTNSSTGNKLLKKQIIEDKSIKTIALIGNPNVGKSTIFNALTGLNQHTGNWPGKTVEMATGTYSYNNKNYNLVDLPGTYSLFSSSLEEEVSRDFICFEKHDLTVIVLDATMLERNLNLATQIIETNDNVLVCLNLMDEAKKKNISIDVNKLSKKLGVPVITTSANNKKSLTKLIKQIEIQSEKKINNENIITYDEKIEDVIKKLSLTLKRYTNKNNNRFYAIKLLEENKDLNKKIFKYLNISNDDEKKINRVIKYCKEYLKDNEINDYQNKIISSIIKNNNDLFCEVTNMSEQKVSKLDKLLTSKKTGIPIMIIFLGIILWLTISGSNYPSTLLSNILFKVNDYVSNFLIKIHVPNIIHDILINGILKTLAWVISVMLPPMAIFFPLFTLLEDWIFT